jgi:hypothetical protein
MTVLENSPAEQNSAADDCTPFLCPRTREMSGPKMTVKVIPVTLARGGCQEYSCGTMSHPVLVHRRRFVMFADHSSILAGTRTLWTLFDLTVVQH